MKKIAASNTTLCLIDTQTHALAARAMRLTLRARDFADALFISDSAEDTCGARHVTIAPLAGRAMWKFLANEDVPGFVAAMHRPVLGPIQFQSLAENFIDLKRLDLARLLLAQRLRVLLPTPHAPACWTC